MDQKITKIVKDLFGLDEMVQLAIPEEQFGDMSTNVAMQLARQVGKPPREIAELIAENLKHDESIADVSIAGPGFLNIRLTERALMNEIQREPTKLYAGKTVICEYSDMNAFKTAHVGHLYTTLVGDAVANLLSVAGATVVRANFGGDVGLHVARAMWAIMRHIENDPAKLQQIPANERSAWVAARYIEGNSAYEDDEESKAEIIEVNKMVYELHNTDDKDSVFAQVYWTCRQWSYDGFEQFYTNLQLTKNADGSHFVYYPESITAPLGTKLVQKGLVEGVFTMSNGAVVYDGETEGLHTRVFLTSSGLPTYEAKDLGLAVKKWQDYAYDMNVIITANDIVEYMKVVVAALRKLLPETEDRTKHLTHGLVKLAGGQKMSSRKGNVLLPEDVLEAARIASKEATGKDDEQVVLAAVKYSFLKNRLGSDIVYDPKESVSIHGNSGPYLQYAHARAKSILRKSLLDNSKPQWDTGLEANERTLVRKMSHFVGVVEQAARELSPHHICTYLYELAQEFNSFYEHNRVIGGEREVLRVNLVRLYADILKRGLGCLGISAPEHM